MLKSGDIITIDKKDGKVSLVKNTRVGTTQVKLEFPDETKTIVFTKDDIKKLFDLGRVIRGKKVIELYRPEDIGNFKKFLDNRYVADIFNGKTIIVTDQENNSTQEKKITSIDFVESPLANHVDYFTRYKSNLCRDHFSPTDLYNLANSIPVFKGHYPIAKKYELRK